MRTIFLRWILSHKTQIRFIFRKMIEEEYYVGKYDPAFVRTKKIEELEFEIKRLQVLINMLKNEKGLL